jgi:ribose-phosphate pyrophosphokinase
MKALILSGTAHPELARSLAAALEAPFREGVAGRFPDGELHVNVGDVRGIHAILVQPAGPPVDEHLMELLLMAGACRLSGTARITAVIPYFGYARQDRRSVPGDALAARLVATLVEASGVTDVVVVDPHTASFEGFFGVPLEPVSAVGALAERARDLLPPNSVVVAPDLGAAKLAESYARALGLPAAFVHKRRINGAEVEARLVTGDVRGKAPLIVDDMITTGGTIVTAVEALLAAGATREITVAATHGVLVGDAIERLRALSPRAVLLTDSLPLPEAPGLRVEAVSIAPLLAGALRRLGATRA